MSFEKAAKKQDIPEEQGVISMINGKAVAIFHCNENFYAIDNLCPHRGGPLGEGDLDGTVVTCPWHAWRWDVTTGINPDDLHSKVTCYPLQIEGEDILVDVAL